MALWIQGISFRGFETRCVRGFETYYLVKTVDSVGRRGFDVGLRGFEVRAQIVDIDQFFLLSSIQFYFLPSYFFFWLAFLTNIAVSSFYFGALDDKKGENREKRKR